MFKNYSYQLVVTIVVAFVCAAMQSYADDARWRYVETPEICGRFQCEFINDSTMLCVSDSCGVYRLSAPDWVAHKVVIDTNEWRFVPRSIARSKDGKIHIVGHRTGWTAWRDSLKNWQLVPMHYTSSDLGVTWNHVNHPDDQYGKYQCISCSKSENTCIVAFDRRTLDDGNEVWFDSHQVVVQVYHNDELRSSVDLSSSGLSDCGRGHYDEFTIRLAYDGINGVAVWYTAPCEKIIWNPDYKRRYREARFYSIDGGLTFPFVIYYPASEAQWFLSVRPTYSTGHIYLSPDILLHYQFVSHDQGKSWNNNPARIPVEGDLDSVWIGELSPGVIKGRTAVGEFSRDLQPIVDGYQVSSLGSFNLDYGGFKVEHTDTLESFGGPARASAAGYAVVAFRPHGMFIRTPGTTSSVATQMEPTISINPSPAANRITITGLRVGEVLMIVSVIGEPVLETMVTDEEISLDVSGLAIGAYIVSAGQGRKVGRLLILR